MSLYVCGYDEGDMQRSDEEIVSQRFRDVPFQIDRYPVFGDVNTKIQNPVSKQQMFAERLISNKIDFSEKVSR